MGGFSIGGKIINFWGDIINFWGNDYYYHTENYKKACKLEMLEEEEEAQEREL